MPLPKREVEFIVLIFVPDTRVACLAFRAVCRSVWSERVPVICHHAISVSTVPNSKPVSFVFTLITLEACHTNQFGRSKSHICTSNLSLGHTTDPPTKYFFQSITRLNQFFSSSTVTLPTHSNSDINSGIFSASDSSIKSLICFLVNDFQGSQSLGFGIFFKTSSIIFCSSASFHGSHGVHGIGSGMSFLIVSRSFAFSLRSGTSSMENLVVINLLV